MMRQAEKELWKLYNASDTIQRRMEDIRQKEAALGLLGISYDALRVQTSPRDKMCDGVVEIVDLCEKLYRLIENTSKELLALEEIISRLKPQVKQEILYRYFRDRKTLVEISEEIAYSYKQTYRLYHQALDEVEEMMKEEK